jgi:hypothetical protein
VAWKETNGIYVHVTGEHIYNYNLDSCTEVSGMQSGPPHASQCYMGNHAVVIVGWGVETNVQISKKRVMTKLPYWIIKNSWGTKWNVDGYCKFAMTSLQYGINTACGLDIPIQINNNLYGGVTTVLPIISQEKQINLGQFSATSSGGLFSSLFNSQLSMTTGVRGVWIVIGYVLFLLVMFILIIKPFTRRTKKYSLRF